MQQKSIHQVDISEQIIIIKPGFDFFIKIAFLHEKQISCPLLAFGTSTVHLQTFPISYLSPWSIHP